MELELEVVVISPVGVVRAQRSSHLQVTLGKLGMLNRQDCLFKEKDVSRSRGEEELLEAGRLRTPAEQSTESSKQAL